MPSKMSHVDEAHFSSGLSGHQLTVCVSARMLSPTCQYSFCPVRWRQPAPAALRTHQPRPSAPKAANPSDETSPLNRKHPTNGTFLFPTFSSLPLYALQELPGITRILFQASYIQITALEPALV